MSEKQSVSNIMREEYRKASKKQKHIILDHFIKLTGYNRNYASRKLRLGKKITIKSRHNVFHSKTTCKRGRPKLYGPDIMQALLKIWAGMDYVCGKRLHAGMKDVFDAMNRFGELVCNDDMKIKMLAVSPATIDRLLRPERMKLNLKGRSTTKPGTLLKSQIPVRLGNEWYDTQPGFIEIDLVAHCGENARGEYINTLDAIDIATGWCETMAVINKAQKHVFEALKKIRERIPFPLLGIDSDNGSEFINAELLRWCTEENLVFTRSRPNRKNDGCHVEEKNWSIVRRNVGYKRFEGHAHLDTLNGLYALLRLHTNFFMPSVKLESKKRDGSRVVKRYSSPITPYRRILASEHVSAETKAQLNEMFVTLNPIELRRQIAQLQVALYHLNNNHK
jgi:hypothetical protein